MALRYAGSWLCAVVAMVTLAAGLVVERGAVLVLVAVIAGFASVLLVGSGTLRRMRARRTPSSAR